MNKGEIVTIDGLQYRVLEWNEIDDDDIARLELIYDAEGRVQSLETRKRYRVVEIDGELEIAWEVY